jgi:hypothetical protein
MRTSLSSCSYLAQFFLPRWKGRRPPLGPLGDYISMTAHSDRVASICLEACVGRNALTFLVFDKADVQVCVCVLACACVCLRVLACACVRVRA